MAKLLFDHFVVLMLENRSFDHVFGYLGKGEGLPMKGGKPAGGMTNHLTPGDPKSAAFSSRDGGDYTSIGDGPAHSLKETNLQLFGVTNPTAPQEAAPPPLSGFVESFDISVQSTLKRPPTNSELQQVMNVFDPIQLPVLSTLAREFVLCDRWFADVPGPTMPNRAFVHAATSQGYTYNANWKPQFTCDTLYDRIDKANDPSKTWRVYYHDLNEVVELYPKLKKNPKNHVLFESNFASDVQGDQLPTYAFIIPGFNGPSPNSMHAPKDVRPAEKLVADIYSALKAKPDVWKKTLFVLLFDEHGGYPDHVPPPATVSPDGIPGRLDKSFLVPFAFKRLGLRVPAILVSPWFQPAVDSTEYSHSTIPGSVIEALNLPGGFLTKRDKQANRLTAEYLIDDGTRTWRTTVPDLIVPAQPQAIDALQRDVLNGTVHLDPHPNKRNILRTQDILDPVQAQQFMRTQLAKHIEHSVASNGAGGANMTAARQLPAAYVSPARIAELRRSAGQPRQPSRPVE